MSLSISFLPLAGEGLPSESFSDLAPRLDFGFLKAKKCPIFFFKVREPEDGDATAVGEVSKEVGLREGKEAWNYLQYYMGWGE